MSETSETSEIKYGITICDTTIYEKDDNEADKIPLERGQLFQIVEEYGAERFMHIYIYNQRTLMKTPITYGITTDYEIIDETLWHMLIAFRNQRRRLMIVGNERFRYFLSKLKVGDEINMNGKALGRFGEIFPSMVRYIGTVPEIGPGIFFGFTFKVC